jgi:hypothetical protein
VQRTIERTGTVRDDGTDWRPDYFAAIEAVTIAVQALLRSDPQWKVLIPPTVTASQESAGGLSYRVHCVLDTEEGMRPILESSNG